MQGGPRATSEVQQLYGHMLDFGDMDLMCSGVQEHAWYKRVPDKL